MMITIVGRVASVAAVNVSQAVHTAADTGGFMGIWSSREVGAPNSQVSGCGHPLELFNFNSASSFRIVATQVHCSTPHSSARKLTTCKDQYHGDEASPPVATTSTAEVDHRHHQPSR